MLGNALQVGAGATVELVRFHMVIPQIVDVLVPATLAVSHHCPRCGQSVTIAGRDLVCLNTSCAPVA